MICDCGARLPKSTTECPDCGKVFGRELAKADVPTECLCGSDLTREGRCVKTGFWPRMTAGRDARNQPLYAPVKCPYACPICRQPLDWDGACFACHGCTTGDRMDWTFPGDRYQRDGAHWVIEAKGPRPACTPEQNREGMRQVVAILSKSPMATKVKEG